MSRAFQHVTLSPAVTSNGHVHKGRKTSVSVADMVGDDMGATSGNGRGSSKTQKNSKGGGVQSKAVDNRAYIDAIKAGFPPDRIVELLEQAITLAVETKSWRGVVAASEFAANYSLGKPVKRVEQAGDTSLADLLAGVDTSKPLLSIGSDKRQYHKLSSDGASGPASDRESVVSGESGDDVDGDDE